MKKDKEEIVVGAILSWGGIGLLFLNWYGCRTTSATDGDPIVIGFLFSGICSMIVLLIGLEILSNE